LRLSFFLSILALIGKWATPAFFFSQIPSFRKISVFLTLDHLEHEISDLLRDNGVELLEFNRFSRAGSTSLRLIADRKTEPFTIEDCARLTRQIKHLIDEKTLINGDYRIEVSSPGLDYVLREQWQFAKNKGRLVKMQIPGEKGPREISARLTEVSDAGITLASEQKTWELRFEEILSAKVLPEFKSTSVESKR
jgi:ribosome maturation factor RimP